MREFIVVTDMGKRIWHAEDNQHALEQHYDAFGDDEKVKYVFDLEGIEVMRKWFYENEED